LPTGFIGLTLRGAEDPLRPSSGTMAAPPASAGAPQFASLYVGDLHPDVTEAMLYEIFNSVGPVASIRVCRDSITRRSLGYGYVNYHSVGDAERALDTLNYSSIKGRSCRIMWSQRDPSLRKSGAGNIYVKNLDKNIDNKALYDTFSLFGNILSCKVASNAIGESYGYGFVHYETEEAAKQAIERVNGMQIGEKQVQVSQFIKRSEREPPDTENYTNLYVKNFPSDWDELKLEELFKAVGQISSTALRVDSISQRAFAFVAFDETDDAKKAVAELHGKDMRTPEAIEKAKEDGKDDDKDVDGHPVHQLYVQRAQTKAERQTALREKFGGGTSNDSGPAGVNLYVKNLDETADEAVLRELFEPFGTIKSVATSKDDRQRCKGFGFVCFSTPDEATKAVTEMHLKVIKGKPLYVGLAERRDQRQERLRQRFDPNTGKGKGGGGKGGKGKMGMMGGMGGMGPMGMQGMMPQGMMGKGMMPPQMMGPMGMKGGPMMPMMQKGGPMMGGCPPMMGMMGKGGPGMMNPQMNPMMAMMQKGGMMGMPMGGKGMMPMGMPQQPRPPQPQAGGSGPLSASALAAAPPAVQKQMIGEKLYMAVSKMQPELAGKITGMMLEMDNSELLILLDSEAQLKTKVDEALKVIQR
jgi:polyadenylate-binding protein